MLHMLHCNASDMVFDLSWLPSGQGQKLGEVQAHKGPISSLQLLADSQKPLLLTAGKLDHVARLHQVSLPLSSI